MLVSENMKGFFDLLDQESDLAVVLAKEAAQEMVKGQCRFKMIPDWRSRGLLSYYFRKDYPFKNVIKYQ